MEPELPFAVESTVDRSLRNSESDSLLTASSQGSSVTSGGPLVPNRRQDVVIPSPSSMTTKLTQQHEHPGKIVVTSDGSHIRNETLTGGGYVDTENDFTYVNVTETDTTDEDVFFGEAGLDRPIQSVADQGRLNVFKNLLCGMNQDSTNLLLNDLESANELAQKASASKKEGDIIAALDYHTKAAKLYRNNAIEIRESNPSLTSSLLLLSQTQAKSAIALKNIVNLNPEKLRQVLHPMSRDSAILTGSAAMSQKERLRVAIRGALSSRHPHEEDLSESQFLGNSPNQKESNSFPATNKIKSTNGSKQQRNIKNDDTRNDTEGTLLAEANDPLSNKNPVDEMMALERELREMDMALELGSSISSLDARMTRMKTSTMGESFMMVTPGSSSYMSSSMWGTSVGLGQCQGHAVTNNVRKAVPNSTNQHQGSAGVRARANRVQNLIEATTNTTRPSNHHQPNNGNFIQTTNKIANTGLESSWWGNTNTASQILASSVMSLGGDPVPGQSSSSAHTKQIMRLMDSLKALGDENSVLLREVEELEIARSEAKTARETMRRFKEEFGKRFSALRSALEKHREDGVKKSNSPVATSAFMQNATVSDQLQRQEQVIRKLTADLKKEKEDSKKKDSALRKYESFYREVKARSAQKAALRQTQQRQSNSPNSAPARSGQS